MANGMKGFLGSKQNILNVPVTTFEGGKAYNMDLEEKLCSAFTMGLIQGNFYTSQEEVIKNCRDLFTEALDKAPELATKYAVYGAETLGMKLFPTLWLVYLSTMDKKDLFKKAFPRIIGTNVKMMHDFVDICRTSDIRPGGIHNQKIKGTNRGMGQGVKKVINRHTYNIINDYNATRFTGDWEDILLLTRPEDKQIQRTNGAGDAYTVDTTQLFQYIFKPKVKEMVDGKAVIKTLPRRLTFERARVLQQTIDILQNPNRTALEFVVALENIKAQKLQMDEIKFTFGKLSQDEKKKVYEYFLPGLRYAALVTNLVSIERAFATNTRKISKLDPMGSGKYFDQTEVLETNIPAELIVVVANKLKNFEDYKASKMLFFRLLTASEMILTREWKKALNEVLGQAGKVAFAELPADRKVRCGADTSGSMGTKVTTSLSALDVASYLTAAITLSVPNTKAYAVADYTKVVPLASDDLVDSATRIMRTDVGYGTRFETLLDGYNGEDVVILVTDGMQSDNMELKWKSLPNRPANSKLIIWHVAGWNYGTKIAKDPSVMFLKGYSDGLLKVLSNLITGKAGQPEVARSIVL